MAFVGSLLHYVGLLIVMLIAAALGLFVGKKLRDRKDARIIAEETANKTEE
ncbi:MAG: vanadium nitrogenase [Lachnospiraceae bacterium]|nr:vanadium nitrogenase [Lachnospiraceae bacterium]